MLEYYNQTVGYTSVIYYALLDIYKARRRGDDEEGEPE